MIPSRRRRRSAAAPAYSFVSVTGVSFLYDVRQMSVQADGSAVSALADGSGAGLNLTQATAGNRPVYRTAANGVNGNPVIEGVSAAATSLVCAGVPGSALFTSNQFTWFVLARLGTSGGSGELFLEHAAVAPTRGFAFSGDLYMDAPQADRIMASSAAGNNLNAWKVWEFYRSGAVYEIRVNGTLLGSRSNATAAIDTGSASLSLMSLSTLGGAGDKYCIAVGSKVALGSTERATIRTQLGLVAGLTL